MRGDGVAAIALAVLIAGCAESAGPRAIVVGTPCARCGMEIEDLRFACADERAGRHRFYDSIECLLGAEVPGTRVWLADYDTRALHPAESTWVVRGDVPSPMGGGFVAFRERAAAEEVAGLRNGRVDRLSAFASESRTMDGPR